MKENELIDDEQLNKMIFNLNRFIKYTGRSHNWFIRNTGISEKEFEALLNGKGAVINNIEKILTLFNIKDPGYFSQKIFELPQHVNKRDIKDYAKLYAEKVPSEEQDFEQSMCMISDFVSLIELMNKVNNINDI